jgi:hypothetical protein
MVHSELESNWSLGGVVYEAIHRAYRAGREGLR